MLLKELLGKFFDFVWWLWFGMLLILDPLASWLGGKYGVGDQWTDTHLIVSHLNKGLRCAVLGWLIYHFLFAHNNT